MCLEAYHNRSFSPPVWLLYISSLLVGILPLSCVQDAGGQDSQFINREPQIKAVYLYKFIKYVQFPADAFAGTASPFVIGVAGTDPVAAQAQLVCQKAKAVGGRKLVYRKVDSGAKAIGCQILFVSGEIDSALQKEITKSVEGKPTLLVGETPSFVQGAGVISFSNHNNRIKLQLSRKNAAKHRLQISSQLAKISKVVD